VSLLYERVPGDVKPVFKAFDLINLPNAQDNVSQLQKDIHPLQFLYDYENQVMNATPFSYYKYMGSQTQPPCAENVLWIVAQEPLAVSTTVLSMFKDAVNNERDKLNAVP
jgi:carbonic anhydrase